MISRTILAAICVLAVSSTMYARGAAANKPATSKPQAYSDWLDAPSAIHGYEMRPLKGYEKHATSDPTHGTLYMWLGSPHPEHVRPYESLLISTHPHGAAYEKPLDWVFNKLLRLGTDSETDFTQSAVVHGTIGGILFARAEWEGTDKQTGRVMRGFCYLGLDGDTVIRASAEDDAAYASETMPAAEASILSLRRSSKG